METATIIHDISEYLAWIKDCYDGPGVGGRPLFFRGHADKSWLLLPSVLRNPGINERRLILDYKQVFALEPNYSENIERILVEMQHHAIPTRLLDWSISPLVALYFACSDKTNKWGEVYYMNPWRIYKRERRSSIPTDYFEILKEARLILALGWSFEEIKTHCYGKFKYMLHSTELDNPLPIVGRQMDPRVSTQQGCFLLWGKITQALDFFTIYENSLGVCKIPRKAKPQILRSLARLGINDFTIMHDHEGFARSVRTHGSLYVI